MKAQRVKNAVIVPTGAKGGFYPGQLPSLAEDRDAWFAEGTECHRIFIRSLPSTSTRRRAVAHPGGVVIRDGEDPISWSPPDSAPRPSPTSPTVLRWSATLLGDVASGGSKGYDHKAMGITAKGAWVSVQRHRRNGH